MVDAFFWDNSTTEEATIVYDDYATAASSSHDVSMTYSGPFTHTLQYTSELYTNATTIMEVSVTTANPESDSVLASINTLLTFYAIPIVSVVGILGNAANLFTLASPRLRSVSYVYLKALAVTDLLCMVFVILCIGSEKMKEQNWPVSRTYWFAFYQAHLMLSIVNWAISSGVLIVVVLTLERFVCCVYPVRFHRSAYNSRRAATGAVLACYLLSYVLYTPYALGRHQVNEPAMHHYRMGDSDIFQRHWWKAYKWGREVALRFTPIVLLAAFNCGIMASVLKRRRTRQRSMSRVAEALRRTQALPLVIPPTGAHRLSTRPSFTDAIPNAADTSTPCVPRKFTTANSEGAHTAAQLAQHRRDESLLVLLLCIVVMYFVCNLPAAVNLLLINEQLKKRRDYQIFRSTANLLETVNHATNFYVFCLCSADYRAALLHKFPCLKHVTGGTTRPTVASLVVRTAEMCQLQRPSSFGLNSPLAAGTINNGFHQQSGGSDVEPHTSIFNTANNNNKNNSATTSPSPLTLHTASADNFTLHVPPVSHRSFSCDAAHSPLLGSKRCGRVGRTSLAEYAPLATVDVVVEVDDTKQPPVGCNMANNSKSTTTSLPPLTLNTATAEHRSFSSDAANSPLLGSKRCGRVGHTSLAEYAPLATVDMVLEVEQHETATSRM